MPSALVADGSIDIEKDAVRDNINGLLAGSMACSSVTPYNALMKVRKVLAYFGIQLPKRAYMEGKHGIEVWEVHQFGDRMGMNDQGEFIKSVPAKYYLFFHYHMFGSMFSVRAKIVDREELDKEIDMAEMMIKEDKDPCWKGYEMIGMKKKGGRKVPNYVPVEEEKSFNEMTPSEKMQWMKDQVQKGKEEKKRLRKSLREKPKKNIKEEQIDEMKGIKSKSAYNRATKQSAAYKMRKKKQPATPRKEKTNDTTGQLQEKAPPGAKFERMVKHIKKGYSKDGLTAKEKSIAYATAWKAKNKEKMDEAMGSVKKDTGYRKFKTKVNTVVRRGLGKKRDTNTILVTMKGDPRARAGGGVRRIPKDKYDPSKHNMATE